MKIDKPKRGAPRHYKRLQVANFTKAHFDYYGGCGGNAECSGCGGKLGSIGHGYRVEFGEDRILIYLCSPCWKRLDFAASAKAKVIR